MSNEEIKIFLRGYRNLSEKIEQITEELKELNAEVDSININLDGMPHGTEISDKTGRLATRLAEMSDKLIDAKIEAWKARQEINDVILRVDDRNLAHILRRRYIDGKTWEEISVEMNCTYRWTTELHGRALQKVKKIIEKNRCSSY